MDLNECSEGLDNCDRQRSDCSNTFGSYTCICLSGYQGLFEFVVQKMFKLKIQIKVVNSSCYDIDECNNQMYNCSDNAACKNLG